MRLHRISGWWCALLIFGYFYSQNGIQGQCPASPTFVVKQGYRLYGHVIYSLYAEKEVLCKLKCNMEGRCLTYNYEESTEICELNDADHEKDLQEAQGFVYANLKKPKKSEFVSTSTSPAVSRPGTVASTTPTSSNSITAQMDKITSTTPSTSTSAIQSSTATSTSSTQTTRTMTSASKTPSTSTSAIQSSTATSTSSTQTTRTMTSASTTPSTSTSAIQSSTATSTSSTQTTRTMTSASTTPATSTSAIQSSTATSTSSTQTTGTMTSASTTPASTISTTQSTSSVAATSTISPTAKSVSQCSSYIEISDKTRHVTYRKIYKKCDSGMSVQWYRFTGSAGTRMSTSCIPYYRCDTDATGWLYGVHPTVQEGIVLRTVCFNYYRYGCCEFKKTIRVLNCGGFYVYELQPTAYCHLRYCGTN